MSSVAPTLVGAVLFTDLVGFTEFNDAVGDVRAVEVLDIQTRLAAEVVDRSADSRVVKELGDGLMLWFGDAGVALVAALDLMRSVESERHEGVLPLAIRMGMHHGEARARGLDVVGNTVNIGARVADLAGPGELLVSDAALQAAGPDLPAGVRCSPIGPVHVKGIDRAIWLQRVSA